MGSGSVSGIGASPKICSATSSMPSRVSARYCVQATPLSSTSTLFRNDGMTLRSSANITSAYERASARGCARIRSIRYSKVWPLP